MAKRNTYTSGDQITIGCKAGAKLHDLVHRMAAEHGVSASEYVRQIVTPRVAADAGVPEAELADEPRPADVRKIVADAAAAQGVTPRQFAARAAAEMAARVLGRGAQRPPSVVRRPASGLHRRVG